MRLDLSAPLPIVPPPEEDELISSWLDRVAGFYGTPTWELFGLMRGNTTVSLCAVDLGTSERALGLIAKRLGITSTQLFVHTIAGVYPWAVDLVARDPDTSTRRYPQRLRYAACPICLEHQKVSRGFSWLRRGMGVGRADNLPDPQGMSAGGRCGGRLFIPPGPIIRACTAKCSRRHHQHHDRAHRLRLCRSSVARPQSVTSSG